MKRVTFKVAKAIKEAGYPQELKEGTAFYCENGLKDRYDSELYELFDPMYCVRPYAMEVWLWLCKKGIVFYPCMYSAHEPSGYSCYYRDDNRVLDFADFGIHNDPEEAIIAAIEYLVSNNLIK